MKFKHLLMSGLIAALTGFFVVGCNENPDDPGDGDDSTQVSAVTSLQAVSLSSTSVGLSWTASTTSGATYNVSWKTATGSTIDDMDVTSGTTATITNLTEGTVYTFTVVAKATGSDDSDPVTVNWSPASRYDKDAENTTLEINIYEFDSQNGSGLVLDAGNDGPSTESMSANNPNIGNVQLAFNLNGDGTFSFGPSFGFPASVFQAADETDQNVVISDQVFTVPSLDAWYMSAALSTLIGTRKAPFTNLQEERTDGNGYGFVIRTGSSAANYRYARVFLKPGGNGRIVRGSAPNRFINLIVSYQNTAGVPYAKPN